MIVGNIYNKAIIEPICKAGKNDAIIYKGLILDNRTKKPIKPKNTERHRAGTYKGMPILTGNSRMIKPGLVYLGWGGIIAKRNTLGKLVLMSVDYYEEYIDRDDTEDPDAELQ